MELHSTAFLVWCVLPFGWACWLFEFRVRSSRISAYLHGPLSFPSRAFTPHHSGLWKFSGPAFYLVSKFSSLCFLLGSSHHCIFKSADSFPCNEQPTANPSLLCLISDATALLSNAHSVFCVVSESSLKIFEHMGHSYGNLTSPSVNPKVSISSGFVLVDWVLSLLQVIFFCFFACLIFWLDAKYCEFNLVGCWVTLNFLQEAIEFLHGLESCFWFVRWDHCLWNLGLSFFSAGGKCWALCLLTSRSGEGGKTSLRGLCECQVQVPLP